MTSQPTRAKSANHTTAKHPIHLVVNDLAHVRRLDDLNRIGLIQRMDRGTVFIKRVGSFAESTVGVSVRHLGLLDDFFNQTRRLSYDLTSSAIINDIEINPLFLLHSVCTFDGPLLRTEFPHDVTIHIGNAPSSMVTTEFADATPNGIWITALRTRFAAKIVSQHTEGAHNVILQ